jgi:threonine/homoserine/homoserine lactone efflux protein
MIYFAIVLVAAFAAYLFWTAVRARRTPKVHRAIALRREQRERRRAALRNR